MRKLTPVNSFEKNLSKFLDKHPDIKKKVIKTLTLLEEDVNSSILHTHKLHGKFSSSYSCRIDYEFRIVFSYDETRVYLEYIGSHDEVY